MGLAEPRKIHGARTVVRAVPARRLEVGGGATIAPVTHDPTRDLLKRWHGGDAEALDELLTANLEWIRSHVRRRLGDRLREKAETDDFVQESVVEMLRYGPRFVVDTQEQFRSLLGRIAENVLRGRARWFQRQRRRMSAERPLPASNVLDLRISVTTPSRELQRKERQAWMRLALELVSAADREVLLAREWENRPFAEIGADLGIDENAARMRFNRALARLARTARSLRAGDLDAAYGRGDA